MRFSTAIDRAERLLERALELEALRYGEFTLTSGATSNYYFDGRLLTTDGESVEIITDMFVDLLMRRDIHRFGGPATAAVPIIGAITLAAFQKGYDIRGYFVRPNQKQHGMGKKIEGHIAPGDRIAIWDDTISTGGSLLGAADAINALPAEIDIALCILDRKQGGGEKLRERATPLFNILSCTADGQVKIDTSVLSKWFE
jgi:orotate phosphoribosyltransferase